jgi:hypothetical protein
MKRTKAGSETVRIDGEELVAVHACLSVCAKHGRTAVRRSRFVLQSRPALSRNAGFLRSNILSIVARLAEHAEKVRLTHFTAWPLCDVCVRHRRVWVTVAAVMFWGGLLAFVAAGVARLVIGHPSMALAPPTMGGLVSVFASVLPFVHGSMPRILGARTSVDGEAVEFSAPHPRFLEELDARL